VPQFEPQHRPATACDHVRCVAAEQVTVGLALVGFQQQSQVMPQARGEIAASSGEVQPARLDHRHVGDGHFEVVDELLAERARELPGAA